VLPLGEILLGPVDEADVDALLNRRPLTRPMTEYIVFSVQDDKPGQSDKKDKSNETMNKKT
jgi:hypothetical protein